MTHQDIWQMQMYVNYYDRGIKKDDENIISVNKMFGAVFGLIRVYVLLFFVMIIYDEFNKFSVVKESVICSSINADVQKRLNKKVATNIKKIKENVSK